MCEIDHNKQYNPEIKAMNQQNHSEEKSTNFVGKNSKTMHTDERKLST